MAINIHFHTRRDAYKNVKCLLARLLPRLGGHNAHKKFNKTYQPAIHDQLVTN